MICDRDKIQLNVFELENQKKCIHETSVNVPHGIKVIIFKNETPSDSSQEEKRIPIDVNYNFGTVGFRNCGLERALIRNVIVEKIDKGM